MKILITGGSGFIGTNYVDYALSKNFEVLNIDIKEPYKKEHLKYYKNCDIMNYEKLEKILKDFKPDYVVHLAAKTGAHSITDLKEFAPNIKGVENLINAILQVDTVKHVIFTSSLLVCKMGYIPKHDTDYMPTTAYGMSKVEGEKIVRNWQNLPFIWTIIRPISVWGPWMVEPYINFFKAVYQGWYFHIGHGHYKRSMGYVENIAHEIHSILMASKEKVDKKTFYVGDPEPTDLYDFAELVREKMGAPKIRKMPLGIAKIGAMVGDILKFLGWTNVPLTSFRLNNILTEYVFDLSPIMEISSPLPYNQEEGIERSIEWMREQKIIK
jgi:nucleoside-diphosphate-sugar epimerase